MSGKKPYQKWRAELCREKEGHVRSFKAEKTLVYPRQREEAGRAGDGAQGDVKLKD